MSLPPLVPTDRTTVRRAPTRARTERELAHAILDEGLVAHVGIAVDGQPFVLPMSYGRDGDRLILHGSVASRLMRGLSSGLPVCVTVTLLDGLVLARSPFHHSMNYRSVVVLGTARRLVDLDEADAALGRLVDHVVPGRTQEVRASTRAELRQTTVLELPIEEASVKVRDGGVNDDPEDLDLAIWAGVLPLQLTHGAPETAPDAADHPLPDSVTGWSRLGVPAR